MTHKYILGMFYKLCRIDLTAILEHIAVLSEGVMWASQLSERQQDAKKSGKAVGIIGMPGIK